MRFIIWSIILILLVGFVSAEIKISCESDSECRLINKDSNCVDNYCFSREKGYITIEDFQPKNNEFQWGVISVEPKTVRCEDCLFAPEKESWFTRFIDWFLFVE